ncbi:MAG: hypothetical protein HC925_00280 [Coleofasciculaceae cyanobacterium SM2_3_26]|nr:hypothetical protein [Coleofasciculaceae cyanobacterium SM2_3_26]
MTVTQTIYPEVLDRNWQVYQRLKLALKLGLRRQIFVAVCDDVSLQNLLAARLHADLTSNTPNVHAHRPAAASVAGCPGLISLRLNIRHPHPTAQIAKWLAKHSLAAADRLSREDVPLPNFQILGIEQLTRQPPSKQWSFLYSLRKLGNTPFAASLLFWLPRPWYHTVQQSVPEFWQCCTGIFEFDGDPTPCSFDMPADVARDRRSSLDPDANQAIADFQRVHPVYPRTDEVAERSNPEVAEVREAEAIARESVESLVESSAEDVATEPIRFIPPSLEQISGVAAPPVPPEIDRESGRASDMPPDTFPPAELVALIQQYPDSDREAKQQVTQAIAVLEDLHHRQAAPRELAEAYLSLGDMCRDWLGDGDVNPATIQLAICAYDRAVQCMDAASPSSLPDGDRRAYILNDIGTLFWMLANSLTEVGGVSRNPSTETWILRAGDRGLPRGTGTARSNPGSTHLDYDSK